jgi:hypothetical protein
MTPVSPVPDPTLNERAITLIDWIAKAAIGLGSVKVFLSGIYRPFMEWRKEHNARTIREVLKPELDQLRGLISEESGCAENMRLAVESIKQVFHELDAFLSIATDNRDRVNETNELLDEIFHLDRRVDHMREAEIDALLKMLGERRTVRRRHLQAMADAAASTPDPDLA